MNCFARVLSAIDHTNNLSMMAGSNSLQVRELPRRTSGLCVFIIAVVFPGGAK